MLANIYFGKRSKNTMVDGRGDIVWGRWMHEFARLKLTLALMGSSSDEQCSKVLLAYKQLTPGGSGMVMI